MYLCNPRGKDQDTVSIRSEQTVDLAQRAALRSHTRASGLQRAWAATPLQLGHAHAACLVCSGWLHATLATVLGGHPRALSCPHPTVQYAGVSMATEVAFFTNGNFLFRDCNLATYCQAWASFMTLHPYALCNNWGRTFTYGLCWHLTFQVSAALLDSSNPSGFSTVWEMHPLDHVLCVPTLWKSSLEDFTSGMLISYQPQNCRLSSLWDP